MKGLVDEKENIKPLLLSLPIVVLVNISLSLPLQCPTL